MVFPVDMDPLSLTCPNCQHRFDLLSGIQGNEQRQYLMLLKDSKLSADQMSLLFRYLNMFRPTNNAMSYRALYSRTTELLKHIKSARVEIDRNVKAAPPFAWFKAIETLVIEKPAALDLPLKNHNYLIRMVFNHADNIEAKKEAKREKDRRYAVRDSSAEEPERDLDSAPVGLQDLLEQTKLLPKTGESNGT